MGLVISGGDIALHHEEEVASKSFEHSLVLKSNRYRVVRKGSHWRRIVSLLFLSHIPNQQRIASKQLSGSILKTSETAGFYKQGSTDSRRYISIKIRTNYRLLLFPVRFAEESNQLTRMPLYSTGSAHTEWPQGTERKTRRKIAANILSPGFEHYFLGHPSDVRQPIEAGHNT